ncbi:MAG: tetratricopeptide repeat protein [Reyranellaceae bacterium]
MPKDAQGLDIANADDAAIRAIDHALEQWLGYGDQLGRLIGFAQQAPDVPLVQMQAAVLNLSLESPEGFAGARPFIDAARAREADMGERETLWLQAVSAWADGAQDQAGDAFAAIVRRWPRDLFAGKTAQLLCLARGDFEGMLRVAEDFVPANREIGYVFGMRAFALEQLNRLDEAEADARRAVEMKRNDPWAHHAVAHVMETRGRMEEGIAWMEGLADTWETCNAFIYGHNWWHTALFYIDSERPGHALKLYDRRIWDRWKEFGHDQANAISLLARLELRWIEVGDRWKDVATYLLPRIHEHCSPFLDLHYVYGLARAGEREAVTEMLASLEEHAERARPFERKAWRDAAAPAAHGLVAYAEGHHAEAARQLGEALPHLQSVGGSHAQRALFEAIHVDALIRAGWNDRALSHLQAADRARGGIAHLKRDLAAIYERLGRAEDAEGARLQAERLARRYQTH